MTDATEASESQFINAELVAASKTKTIVLTGAGKYEETNYGDKLTMPCELDKKKKLYRPNKDSATNLIKAFGTDTIKWLGKPIKLRITRIQGKDSVIAEAGE